MTYRYFHDPDNKTVYQIPNEPDVIEQKDRKTGRIIRWTVRMHIALTRADNVFLNNHWKHACGELRSQEFDANRYSRELAVSYFLTNNTPKCDEINQDTYKSLKSEYEIQSSANIYDINL